MDSNDKTISEIRREKFINLCYLRRDSLDRKASFRNRHRRALDQLIKLLGGERNIQNLPCFVPN